MKKYLSIFLVFLVLLTQFACENSSKSDSNTIQTSSSESPTKGGKSQAESYLGVVNDLISKYGEGKLEATKIFPSNLTGVSVVRLIDFDGDGNMELYCAYMKQYYCDSQVIYGYGENGLYVLLEECSVSNPGMDIDPQTIFLTKENVVYLKNVQQTINGEYLTVVDGKMVSALKYLFDVWEDGEFGDSHFNGEVMSTDEVRSKIQAYEADGILERIKYVEKPSQSVLDETKKTIEALKSLVP